MRHKTALELPGRCKRCYQRDAHCLCAEIPTVHTRTRFVVIRHSREAPKSTGTARVAGLAMPALTLRAYGSQYERFSAEGLDADGTWLLFPSDDGPLHAAPTPPPSQVVVLDGTWAQAKAMLRRVPVLAWMPRLHLRPVASRLLRLRAPPSEDGMSTLEAIARAVALLEGEERAAPLDALHARWVERCLRSRGKRLEDAWAEVDARLERPRPRPPARPALPQPKTP